MDSKLNELLQDVQQQVLYEQTRREVITETAWSMYVERLPLDFTNIDEERASLMLENTIRHDVSNGLPSDDIDYAVLFAQEYLNDVDFHKLARRLGAHNTNDNE